VFAVHPEKINSGRKKVRKEERKKERKKENKKPLRQGGAF